nr:28S ribosomal protein S18b, mitochondrial-like [Lytechinus pictus]
MAASVRANYCFRVIGNAVLRRNPLCISRVNPILYRAGKFSPKNIISNIGQQTISTSVLRWDEINEGTEATKPQIRQEELTEDELLQAIEYLNSEEYMERYGDKPVWANYKRNHKGRIPPMKTRKTCIRGYGEKQRISGNPCPICRDSRLILHYKNVKLLEQFICPHSWNIYSTYRTGLCQKQHKKLCASIEKARRYGALPYSIPNIEYNYEDYYQDETAPVEKKRSVDI